MSVISLILGLVLAGISYGFGIARLRKWKAMRDTPTRKIVDIEPGRVEVEGRLSPIPGRLLKGPVSGKPCISYEVKVQEYHSSKNGGHWRTIHKEREGGPFLLKDDSGMVVVDPKGGKMRSVLSLFQRQGTFSELNDSARTYLESRKIRKEGFFGIFNRTLRIQESIVPVDKYLYVLGDAVDIDIPREVKDNYLVNPFTIKKRDLMVLSYKEEEKTSKDLLSGSIFLIILGTLALIGGIYLTTLFWGI